MKPTTMKMTLSTKEETNKIPKRMLFTLLIQAKQVEPKKNIYKWKEEVA